MEHQDDVIAPISPSREKFFGCSGRMVLPSPKTVAAFIQKMPVHTLISTALLRTKLAEQFAVEATCPVALRNALQALAKDTSANVAYWRVVKKKGELISTYPGGLNAHAAMLKKDGYEIDLTGKLPRVKHFVDQTS